ncbi:MAG TPA: hypothetical protein DCO75_08965 [Fibrobacteres bacterium]|nr:hypothetical protein [Fibrobacterota bacterium]
MVIRPKLLAANGAEVAGNYDLSLQIMESKVGGKDFLGLRQEANNSLEIVDKMELAFVEVAGGEEND